MNERIKALRKELGLTQDQLADELAITRQTLYTWESGLRTPPKKMLSAICQRFGVSLSWLETGEGEMFTTLPEHMLENLAATYHLDQMDMKIIRDFMELPAEERQVIKKFFQGLVKEKEEA